MRNFLFIILLTCSVELGAQEVTSLKIGALMEEINKQDDITRVVNLWATWCAPCVKELPYFEEVNQAYQNKKVKVYLVAVEDEVSRIESFANKKNLQSEVFYLDETDANAWIPQIDNDWQGEIPITLIINNAQNQADKQRQFHSGALTKEELVRMIEKSLN